MFWIQALTEVKVINVISTIFYVHRGLSLPQILYLAMAFSVVSLLTEVPSSYWADKWSRKGLIIWSLVLGVIYWVSNIFARGFWPFMAAICIYSAGYSLMSGTDEALVYDSTRELDEEQNSLGQLGKYFSAQRIFKIFTPIVAVLIATNLADWQFNLILMIDVVANLAALILATRVTEAKHYFEVEKVEAGVMKDALSLVKKDPRLINITMNKTLLFVASFMVWRIGSQYFTDLKVPIVIFGITTAAYQSVTFIFNLKSHQWFKKWTSEEVIGGLNMGFLISMGFFLLNQIFWKNQVVALILFSLICNTESIRWPYFSEIINKSSSSYNRATVLSLTNMVKSVLDIPLLLLGSVLIAFNYTNYFWLILVIGVVGATVFRIKPVKEPVSRLSRM